jgi:hypothetical protein
MLRLANGTLLVCSDEIVRQAAATGMPSSIGIGELMSWADRGRLDLGESGIHSAAAPDTLRGG